MANKVNKELVEYKGKFGEYCTWLEELVAQKDDYKTFTYYEKNKFRIAFKLAVIIKNITCAELMDNDNTVLSDKVNEALKENRTIYDGLAV